MSRVGEGVIVHGLFEIDSVKNLDSVVVALKQLANLADYTTFRKRFVKTECAFYLQTFYEQLTSCLDGGFIRTLRRCEYRF